METYFYGELAQNETGFNFLIPKPTTKCFCLLPSNHKKIVSFQL